MSRTQLPPMGKVYPAARPMDILLDAYDDFVMAYGDMDKCGDMEDHAYYAGRVDAMWDIIHGYTDTPNPVSWVAEKTTSLIGDQPTPITRSITMNEQTAVDVAETIVPDTARVATTVQNLAPFAAGVGFGVLTVVVARRVYLKRKKSNATVFVAKPTND